MRTLLDSIRNLVRRADKRHSGARVPIHQGAYLAFGERLIPGTARDLSLGGVFFETPAPIAIGSVGAIARTDSQAMVPVRVTWVRPASKLQDAGVGLAFESD